MIAKRLKLQLCVIHGEETKYAEALSEERLDPEAELAGMLLSCTIRIFIVFRYGLVCHFLAVACISAEEETEGDALFEAQVEEASFGGSLIGSVNGHIAIIVDDLLDGAATFSTSSCWQMLKAR